MKLWLLDMQFSIGVCEESASRNPCGLHNLQIHKCLIQNVLHLPITYVYLLVDFKPSLNYLQYIKQYICVNFSIVRK